MDWDKIPFFHRTKEEKVMLQILRELHSGEAVDWIKLDDVASQFSVKIGKPCTSREAEEILKRLYYDVIMKKHGDYCVAVSKESLDITIQKYERSEDNPE